MELSAEDEKEESGMNNVDMVEKTDVKQMLV